TMPFTKSGSGDKFLRAGIDKATGEAFYQFYLYLVTSRQAFRPSRMTYLVAGKVAEAKADRVAFDVNCYRGGCTYHEDAIFTLPREAIEEFASCAAPGSPASFRVKIFGDTTEGFDTQMLCTEAA